jgi:hypothetical protein
MATKLSIAEQKAITNWFSTDTGATLLKMIKETEQGYLDEAMVGINQGPQHTHDRVVAAQAIETIYQWLKAYRIEEKKKDED